MKDDVISRQVALQAMDTWDKFGCGPDGRLVRCGDDKHYVLYVHYDDMVYAIKHLPSAQPHTEEEIQKIQDLEQAELEKAFESGREDAQSEIIRCKDCYHYPGEYADCPMIGWGRNGEDFCSKAERRQDDA